MNHPAPPSNGASNSSQQPSLRTLRGTQPGLLDPTQPSRILRFPDSKLFFASFDPKTALVEDPSIQKLNISENLTPPKRVVVETTLKGANFWRFVPRARLEEGTQDEGIWPRVIDICGEKVQCFQEQWEIYKLDPLYQCVVYPWPKYSVVVKVELANQTFEAADPLSKRTQRPSPEVPESPQKRARSRHVDEEDDLGSTTDEAEIEEMMVDDAVPQKPKSGRRPDRTSRDQIKKERLRRWAKNRTAQEKRFQEAPPPPPPPADGSFSMRVDTEDTFPSQQPPSQQPSSEKPPQPGDNTKRKDDRHTGFDDNLEDERIFGSRHKRARTLSPGAAREAVNKSHAKYEKKKWERLRQHGQLNREALRRKLNEARSYVPPEVLEVDEDGDEGEEEEEEEYEDDEEDDESEVDTSEANSQPHADPAQAPSNPESSREAEIAESIRKLRELERDRPLWEEQRKRREARERADQQERLRKAEEQRRRFEEEQEQIREHLTEQARRMEEMEARRRAQEEELRQRSNHQRRQRQRWDSGLWTTHRALERYRMLSDEFDAAKFTPEQPITFQDIPWPVLHPPSRLTVEDIDWSAVESFFATVKLHMRLQDYKDFVEKSHRRFHPDRWRARKLWAAVTDEVERGCLEVAANTVAQALTPIWRTARGI